MGAPSHGDPRVRDCRGVLRDQPPPSGPWGSPTGSKSPVPQFPSSTQNPGGVNGGPAPTSATHSNWRRAAGEQDRAPPPAHTSPPPQSPDPGMGINPPQQPLTSPPHQRRMRGRNPGIRAPAPPAEGYGGGGMTPPPHASRKAGAGGARCMLMRPGPPRRAAARRALTCAQDGPADVTVTVLRSSGTNPPAQPAPPGQPAPPSPLPVPQKPASPPSPLPAPLSQYHAALPSTNQPPSV